MTVAEASITAYRAHVSTGAAASQHAAILAVMRAGVRYSRRQVAELAGIETSACAGRCNELIEMRKIEPAGSMACPITGRSVEAVALQGFTDSGGFVGVAGVRSGRIGGHPVEVSSSSLLENAHAGARTAQPGTHSSLQCSHLGYRNMTCIKCCAKMVLSAKGMGKDRVLGMEASIDYHRSKGLDEVPSQEEIRELVREHWGRS